MLEEYKALINSKNKKHVILISISEITCNNEWHYDSMLKYSEQMIFSDHIFKKKYIN
jgi:hypothetical protein